MLSKRFYIAYGLLSFSFVCAADPAITWTVKPLSVSALIGSLSQTTVGFTSDQALSNIDLQIVPSLSPFISVIPASLAVFPAGTVQFIALQIKIPATTLPQILTGTLHVRRRSATLAEPLPIILTIKQANAFDIPAGPAAGSDDRIITDPNLPNTRFLRDQLDIVFQPNTDLATIRNVVSSINGAFLGSIAAFNEYEVLVQAFTGFDALDNFAAGIRGNPVVKLVMPHIYLRSTGLVFPTDPGELLSYAPNLVNLPAAWGIKIGSQALRVGIIDNFFDFNHPDLKANNAGPSTNSFAFTDPTSHGTRVASIVGAAANNGVGIAGVMWNVSLYLYSTGIPNIIVPENDKGFLADAIVRAINDGVRVVNVSAGFDCSSSSCTDDESRTLAYWDNWWKYYMQETATIRAKNGQPDILWIFSAGNHNVSVSLSSPARLAGQPTMTNVIAVGAVDQNSQRSVWFGGIGGASDYGSAVTVSAPGTLVTSDTWGGSSDDSILFSSGTSFAAPFVAGTAGLMLSVNSLLTPAQIKSVIRSTAKHTGNYDLAGNEILVLNAFAAVSSAKGVFTSRSSFLAATSSTTNITFEGLAPASGASTFHTPSGLTVSGVNFVGAESNGFGYYLIVWDGNYTGYGQNFSLNGSAALMGPVSSWFNNQPYVGTLVVTLPAGTTAVGTDYGVDGFWGSINGPHQFTITLSTGQVFNASVPQRASNTLPPPQFIGFTSSVPISTIVFSPTLLPNPFGPNVISYDNFVFGSAK